MPRRHVETLPRLYNHPLNQRTLKVTPLELPLAIIFQHFVAVMIMRNRREKRDMNIEMLILFPRAMEIRYGR